MKKAVLKLFLIVLFLFVSVGEIIASDLSLGRMRVALWPEYDDSGVLVIYDGRFKDEGSFPAETTFLLPKGSVISDACSLSPKGQHFCQLYKQKNIGNVDEIRIKLPYPNFYLSFHINPFREKKDSKNFTYTVDINHDADRLEVDIQKPLRAEVFNVTPQSPKRTEKKGFEHYGYVFEKVSKGNTLDFKIEYIKKDNLPSVDIKYSPMAGGNVQRPSAAYETPQRLLTILYIAGGIGLILLLGMLWITFKRKR